jgi:hypothetical protein
MTNYISRSLFFCDILANMHKAFSLITVFLFVFTLTISFHVRTVSKSRFTEKLYHTWEKNKKKSITSSCLEVNNMHVHFICVGNIGVSKSD